MSASRPRGAESVLAHLPLGCVSFDSNLLITFADERAARLVDSTAGELLGTSVIDLVHPDDLDTVAALLSFSTGADDGRSGLVPIRALTRSGRVRRVEVWVEDHEDDPEHPGFTIIVVPETVDQTLARAVTLVADAVDHEVVLDAIVAAGASVPLEAATALIELDGVVHASTGLPEALRPSHRDGGPWHSVMETGEPSLFGSLETLDAELRAQAEEAGYAALWCWPVTSGEGDVEAVLALWRRAVGFPGPDPIYLGRMSRVCRLAIEADRRRQVLRDQARRDPLTGLGNRLRLEEAADAGLGGRALLYVDLDRFKAVNDRYGHEAGDRVLTVVGQRLRRTVRSDDIVTRIGGDEFVIVTTCDQQGAVVLAERIVDSLGRPVSFGDTQVSIGASVGIAIRDDQEGLDSLVRRADRAMYRAKHGGRNGWEIADVAA